MFLPSALGRSIEMILKNIDISLSILLTDNISLVFAQSHTDIEYLVRSYKIKTVNSFAQYRLDI